MPNYRRVYKQGNSLVVSFPAWMFDLIHIKKGDQVLVEAVPGKHIKISGVNKDAFEDAEEEIEKDK